MDVSEGRKYSICFALHGFEADTHLWPEFQVALEFLPQDCILPFESGSVPLACFEMQLSTLHALQGWNRNTFFVACFEMLVLTPNVFFSCACSTFSVARQVALCGHLLPFAWKDRSVCARRFSLFKNLNTCGWVNTSSGGVVRWVPTSCLALCFLVNVIHAHCNSWGTLDICWSFTFYRRNTQNLNLQGLKTCDDVQNHFQIGSCNKQWGLHEWSFPIFLQRASLWIVPAHSNAQICSNLDHHYDGYSRRLGTTRIPKTHGISSHSLTGSTFHIRRSKGDNFGWWKLFWLQSLQLKCVQWPWSGWTSLWLRQQGHCFGRAPPLRIPWWNLRCLCHRQARCRISMT